MVVQETAFQTLRKLREAMLSDPSPVLRIAYKWAKRASDATLDLMFRLSMLEGAAGVTPGSWSDNPSRGLDQATDHYSVSDVDPDWLSTRDQGVYRYLLRMTQAILRSSGLEGVSDLSADEILINAYMGLARSGGTKKRVLYEAGKALAAGINSGVESPMKAAGGKAKVYIRNKALDEIKTYRRKRDRYRIDIGEEGSVEDRGIRDERIWDKSRGEYFTQVLFDPSDRLGQQIRRWVRDFLGKVRGSKYLQAWFDMSLEARRPVSQRDVANVFGVAPTGLGRYFKPGLKKLQDAFWRTDYAELLEDNFFAEGGRVASNRKLIKLALRWMARISSADKQASQVAQTILQQLGGARRLQVMLGAKQFLTSANGVQFKFPNRRGPNYVKITLTPDDTYAIEFGRTRGYNYKKLKDYSGIYAEQLVELFEKVTGLHLRF